MKMRARRDLVGAILAGLAVCCSFWSWSAPGTTTVLVRGNGYTGVIFPVDRARMYAPFLDPVEDGYWEPTVRDIQKLESRLKPALEAGARSPILLNAYSALFPNQEKFTREQIEDVRGRLSEYRRQYVGLLVKGSKRIYLNAFPNTVAGYRDDFDYWQEEFVSILDGGTRFWQIEYDVQTKQFLNFSANGDA